MRIAPHRFTTAMLGLIAGLLTATSPLAAQVPDELAGNWQMDDMSPSLLYPSNKPNFNILRATSGKK
tara:strand:- start:5342 stop:5542 length:201 start_codon:yes stop_codon:yes gene_type:complete